MAQLFFRLSNIFKENGKEAMMSKNKLITSLIIGAVLFSSLAAFLIYHYMAPARSTIYMFNDSYSSGEQVTSDMLTPVQVDSQIVMAGKTTGVSSAFVTPSEYQDIIRSGDSLRMDVTEGMPLTTGMLSVSGGSKVEMSMKSDAIAVTVPVNEYTGITNDLKEGARVNIYANLDSTVALIQQNKRVLEVFKSNDGVITGVAVEENIQESMELIYAVTNGSIYLGLVDSTGYQASEGAAPTYSPYSESYSEIPMETEVQTEAELETETEPETESEPATETEAVPEVFTP